MEIGYHYTTRAHWESIQEHGLRPNTMIKHELEKFREAIPKLPKTATWVWRHPPEGLHAFISCLSLACMHGSTHVVLLEVEYDIDRSAMALIEDPDDIVKLYCSFGAGKLDTGRQPINLILDTVPAHQIQCVNEWDLINDIQWGIPEYAQAEAKEVRW